MNKPSLYSRASDIQRRDAKDIVKEYSDTVNQHSGGKQSLLDVGSGSGNVLMEILVPAVAKGFTRITGVDISPKMVMYLRESYAQVEGVDFKELDIETEHLPLEFQEQFDRVTSFYCLHWIKNQKKALENILKALRSNGDCLLILPASISIHDVYKALIPHPRWGSFMRNQGQFLSPLFDHPKIGEVYESMLEEVGFVDQRVDVKEKVFVYEGYDSFKDNMKAISPFPFSDLEFDEFFVDFCDRVESMGLKEAIPGSEDYRFLVKYRLVIIVARKEE